MLRGLQWLRLSICTRCHHKAMRSFRFCHHLCGSASYCFPLFQVLNLCFLRDGFWCVPSAISSSSAVSDMGVTSSQHPGGVRRTAQYIPLPEKPCWTAKLPSFPMHLHWNSTLYTVKRLNSAIMDPYWNLDSVSRKIGDNSGILFEFHFPYLVEYITAEIIVFQSRK